MRSNVLDLFDSLSTSTNRERIEIAFNLRQMANSALFSQGYDVAEVWSTFIVPSDQGKRFLDLALQRTPNCSKSTMALALFRTFFHTDFLVDIDRSDWDAIRTVLQDDLLAGRMRWPFRFGRLLYDRFNDLVFPNRTETLSPSEGDQLLDTTPQGVYQQGTLLWGPLGILNSRDARFLPAFSKLPLWHCSDTGCNALHQVTLMQHPSAVIDFQQGLTELLIEKLGPSPELERAFYLLHRGDRWPHGRPYHDLPSLLAEAFSSEERVTLLTKALESTSGPLLREVLAGPPRRRSAGEGPAAQVARRQGEAEQLQLLCILPDDELVDLIDSAILSKSIRVPATEVRAVSITPGKMSWLDRTSEVSCLGVRSQPESPIVSLAATIWESYKAKGLLDDLGWRLTQRAEPPTRGDLTIFLRTAGPRQATQDLILTSRPITVAMAERLQLHLPNAGSLDDLVERFLWKSGFNPPRYGEEYSRLRTRLRQFNEVLLRVSPIRTEEDREQVRAAGVNLFISVEHFLEQIVAFSVWLLSSDHFEQTGFVFDPRAAVAAVVNVLGSSIKSGDQEIHWSRDGGNTLGASMAYFARALGWVDGLMERDRTQTQRPLEDVPHYTDDPDRMFPFKHIELWADADPDQLTRYLQGLKAIYSQLSQSNLAGIRNAVDHRRDEQNFPSVDNMLACVARITEALELADAHRYLPKVFWLESRSTNYYGGIHYTLVDYLGRRLELYGPSPVLGLPIITYDRPYIVAPGDLLGQPTAELRFFLQEASLYSEYWGDYPRRRRIPSPETVLPVASGSSGLDGHPTNGSTANQADTGVGISPTTFAAPGP